MSSSARSVVEAPAKLNLGLAIAGRRSDGYHELRSIFVRIGLADRLSGAADDGLEVDRLRIDGADELNPAEDIVLRAVRLLRREAGGQTPPLDLALEKRIPVGAGLGGGSSDAAAALSLACDCWSLTVRRARLVELSAELGADVPFFARGLVAASVTGTGDLIEPLSTAKGGGDPGAVLLVTPEARLSTKAVFEAFDRSSRTSSGSMATIDEVANALLAGIDGEELARLAPSLRDANDLWPAALELEPSLGPLRDQLERTLDRPVLLTGSGSTLFAVYPSLESAKDAGRRLRAQSVSELEHTRLIAAVPIESQPPEDHHP